ncbi:uncharacterized protein LOC135482008 [Liolophura sinensis]|uniref:uncharacterized protein LOC135482008 n=1 Tax=Liolophura sinensis TaxID=3198878 RepID=UPI0031584BF5
MSEEEGMQTHCCCCVSGVLLTFLGISLLSTGISMVLDYGAFDVSSLPSGWQSSDGQRNLGIILIFAAVLSLTISVVASVLFFTSCYKGRTGSHDSETGAKGPNPVEESPSKLSVVVTVAKPSDTTSTRSSHRRSKGKHGRKKSRKQALVQLETHHESIEEHYDYPQGRDTRSAKRRSANSAHLRETQKLESGCAVLPDHMDGGSDAVKPVTNLPPLLIASAPEEFSINDADNTSLAKFNEPEVFRLSPERMSSEGSVSIIASSSTEDTVRPWPSPRDTAQQETFDRELSDILK